MACRAKVGLWVLPWKLKSVFGTSPGALARAVGLPTAWGALASAGLYWLTRHHQPENWLLLGAEMSAAVGNLGAAGSARNQEIENLLWSLYNKVDFIFNY